LPEKRYVCFEQGSATQFTTRGVGATDAYLQNFVKELIASGFIAKSIEKHQIKGLTAIKG
jgi:hypothetical protein